MNFKSNLDTFETDCLVISSLEELNKAKSKAKPILILVKASVISWVYSISLEGIDKIVVIKDTFLFNQRLLPNYITSVIVAPSEIINFTELKLKHRLSKPQKSIVLTKPRILIKIEPVFLGFNPIYHMIRFINTLNSFDVKIKGITDEIMKLCNNRIMRTDEEDIDLLNEADLVIGNGSIIYKAIFFGKPAIVIGNNGIGGFVSETTIMNLYEFLFTGRPGGGYNEVIPENVLYHEMKEILGRELKETLDFNTKFLMDKCLEFKSFLAKSMLEAKDNYEKKASISSETKLCLSSNYTITSWINDSFKIEYVPLAKNYALIEKDEAVILSAFKETNSIENIAKEMGYENDFTNFFEFVKSLVNEQILLVQ